MLVSDLLCERQPELFILDGFCCTDPRDELRFPTFNILSMDAVQLAEQLTDIAGVCYVTVAVYSTFAVLIYSIKTVNIFKSRWHFITSWS